MATTDVDATFIDTNVLVHASRPSSREHEAARAALAAIKDRGQLRRVMDQRDADDVLIVTRLDRLARSAVTC